MIEDCRRYEPRCRLVAVADEPGKRLEMASRAARDVFLQPRMISQREAIQLEAPTERLRARAVALFEHLHVIVAGRELHDRSGENVDAAGGDRAGDIEDGDGVEVAIELELLRDVALALEPGEEPPAAHEIPRHVDRERQLSLVHAVERQPA